MKMASEEREGKREKEERRVKQVWTVFMDRPENKVLAVEMARMVTDTASSSPSTVERPPSLHVHLTLASSGTATATKEARALLVFLSLAS